MLDEPLQQQLLAIAEASIRRGLTDGELLTPDMAVLPDPLRKPGASFVTLRSNSELRGCIGTLTPHRPLAEDVANNAYAAAFRDVRFLPLRNEELKGLDIHISVLTDSEPVHFDSETDLLQQLRPGEDGLILEEGFCRGTFLPSVWEQLPSPELFLGHLKQKAGLPADYWSDKLKVSRYTTFSFGTTVRD